MNNSHIKNEVLQRAKVLDAKRTRRKRAAVSIGMSFVFVAAAIFALQNLGSPGADPLPSNTLTAPTETSASASWGNSKATTKTQEPPATETQPEKSNAQSNRIQLFKATAKDPDTDAFGEDQVHSVNFVYEGRLYRQIEKSKYTDLSLKQQLSGSNYGKQLGVIQEVSAYLNVSENGCFAQDPVLAGAKVYAYAPLKGKAVMIVEGEHGCSLFLFDDFVDGNHLRSFSEYFAVYGVSGASDIQLVAYTVDSESAGNLVQLREDKVMDSSAISRIYNLLVALKPYSIKNPSAPTPEWLNDAWESYKTNPQKALENYTIHLRFKNGLALKDISYQPFLGTGYVENMEMLSEAQNRTLKALLGG